jgi:hypothetical protein
MISLTLLTPDTTKYHTLLYAKLEDLTSKILCLTLGWLILKHTRARLKANDWLSSRMSGLEGVRSVNELCKITKAQTMF